MMPNQQGNDASNESANFIDTFYDGLNEVIGGRDASQFLCLTLPGTILNPQDYHYDSKKEKPVQVAVNESRLANKLFDPVKATGADNGRTLTTQYKTALDLLSPSMNLDVMKAKIALRDILAQPYTYNFGQGDETSTLQQVFYRLYDEWVAEKKHWAEIQTAKKKELRSLYPKTPRDDVSQKALDDEDNYQEEFLTWYQDNAETYLIGIEEKLGKILGVFSINDMAIIKGILDAGVGGELYEARLQLENAEKLDPMGGKVYPVTFLPSDWHTKLTSNFDYIDLLESKEALTDKLGMLTRQKQSLLSKFDNFVTLIPSDIEFKNLVDNYQAVKESYRKAFSDVGETYTDNFGGFARQIVEIIKAVKSKDDKTALAQQSSEQAPPTQTDGKNDTSQDKTDKYQKLADKVIAGFNAGQSSLLDSQSALDKATQDCLAAAMAVNDAKLGLQLKQLVTTLKEQMDQVDLKIADVTQKLALTCQMNQTAPDVGSTLPNVLSDGYTELLIQSDMSSAYRSDVKHSKTSTTSSSGGCWFFGGNSSSSHSEGSGSMFSESASTSIEIGMAVAKITINRDWFNPGVFALTEGMYRTAKEKISNQPGELGDGGYKDLQDCIFPVYPTAFVLAKDVTITLKTENDIQSSDVSFVENQSSSSGGFFGFHTSSGSSDASSSSQSSVQTAGKTITVRFAQPQIIGYYLQIVPEDKSVLVKNSTGKEGEMVSILDFVDKMKETLQQAKTPENQTTD
ncbi:MAG: hypothetical protein LBS41_04710 [Streptococcaceae bacterium]|jgi:hypothetical protein|nr:hypothetical protein [Streptococcaceae bacterium]